MRGKREDWLMTGKRERLLMVGSLGKEMGGWVGKERVLYEWLREDLSFWIGVRVCVEKLVMDEEIKMAHLK